MPFEKGDPEANIRSALALLRQRDLIKPGDPIVILSDALHDESNVDAILLRQA
jgi:hypothetical protein